MSDMAWAEAIGGRIRDGREKLGLSRPQLADLLTIHVNTLRGYETGEPVPWLELPRIAEALDVSLRWLLHGHEYQDPLLDVQEKVEQVLAVLLERELSDAGDEQAQPQEPEHAADADES